MNIDYLVDACGWTLIHFLWQGAAVGLMLAVALASVPRCRVRARYAAACTALALMVVSAAITFYCELCQIDHLLNELPADVPTTANIAGPSAPSDEGSVPVPEVSPVDMAVHSAAAGYLSNANPAAASPTWSARLSAWLAPWIGSLVLLWAVGVALFTARLAVNWYAVQNLRASGRPIDDARWLDRLSRISERLAIKPTVALLESARIRVPMALGWLRPAILVPAQMVTGLTPVQLQAILAHELAHIRRYDNAVNLLQNMAETVLFFHPAVWWASSQIRRERECCCDAIASADCDGPLSYAQALVAVEKVRCNAPLAVAASGGSLLDRIRRLSRQEPRARQSAGAAFAALTAATLALLLAISVHRASAVDDAGDDSQQSSAESPDAAASVTVTQARAIAVAAHEKAAALNNLPAFYCEVSYRNGDIVTMREVDAYSLENLRRAMHEPVADDKWIGLTGLLAWDKRQVLLEQHHPGLQNGDGGTTDYHQISFGDPAAGWSQVGNDDQPMRYVRRPSIQAFWEDSSPIALQFIQATPRKFWWGDNCGHNTSHNPVPPSMVSYRHLGQEQIDGEPCDIVESTGRAERLWVGRRTGLIRAALYYIYQGRMNAGFYQHPSVQRVADRQFSSDNEYRQWYEAHKAKLTAGQQAELSRAFYEAYFDEMAREASFVLFSDYREIAPGVWLPFKEERTGWHHSGPNEEKFKYFRCETRVQNALTGVDLTQRIAALMPKKGNFVQDQRFEGAVVEYKWRDDITPEEIEHLVQQKRLELEDSRRLIDEIKAPMQKLVGQPAPLLTAGDWLGKQPELAGKPYLIHFWATWCGPCKNDFEILKHIARTRKIIGMHPAGTPRDKVTAAIQDAGLNYPTFISAASDKNLVGGYPVRMYPYCVVVDADGRIATHGSLTDVAETFGDLNAAADKVPSHAENVDDHTDTSAAADAPKAFTNSIEMKLTLIPAGEFMMGSAKSVLELSRLVTIYFGVDRAMETEHPQHRVSITQPYYISTTEVTQSQWENVMGTRPWSTKPRLKEGANFPAAWVSWDDAKEFCSRLSREDGRNYRLPTEAEWEYACRAQTTTIFSFGDDVKDLPDHGWFDENADRQNEDYAHHVARQKANPWGLYDVHGNVREWCSDWYGADYYAKSPTDDPKGPNAGSERVVRSGSWRNSANHSRSAFRFGIKPTDTCDDIGFRVVAEVPGRHD